MVWRRDFVAATLVAPWLSGCATDLGQYSGASIEELAKRRRVCAASYVVLREGKAGTPVFLSGCAPRVQMRADAVFQAASLTKPVVAFAALALVRAGKLDLTAPVSRYLPNGYAHRQNPFGGSKVARFDQVSSATLGQILVASLLNHSSGLPNWSTGPLERTLESGQRWQYSGEGYVLLQAVLAAASGQPFESLIENTVFEPLQMRDSRMRWMRGIQDRVVDGTSWLGGKLRFDLTEPNAAASLYTTAEDYAKLMVALVADQSLLSLTLANPVTVDPKLGLSWGSGWGIEEAQGGPYLWQWGNNPGFRAFAMVSSTSKNGFVLLTNSDRGMALAAPIARATVPADHGVFRFPSLG